MAMKGMVLPEAYPKKQETKPQSVDSTDHLLPSPGAGGTSPDHSHQSGHNHNHQRKVNRGLFAYILTRFIPILITLILLFVFITSGLLVWLDHHYTGQIYPNITIRGFPVGKMTPEQARETLQQRYASFLSQPLIIRYHEQTWTPTPENLGMQIAFEHAIAQAMSVGRHYGYMNNIRQVAAVWHNGLEIPLDIAIDKLSLQEYLLHISAEINHPASDAQLLFDGDIPTTIPSVSGRQVQVNEMVEDIVAALQRLEPQQIPLRTLILPPLLSTEDADQTSKTIETITQTPLTLKTNNEQEEREWIWSTTDIGHLVQVSRTEYPDPPGDRFTVSLDEHEIYRRVSEIAEATKTDVVYPRVDWNGGDLRIIQEGKAGLQVDEAQATGLIATTLLSSPDRVIQLPFRKRDSPVTAATLPQLGITELIAVGRSDFAGSEAYRITNIQAGMQQLHGILVAPGDVFSFNENISITAANGYVEGYAIIQNRTQLEWGGGICQDSTTMFRAAFWGGFPILERWGHSFYINWYDKYGYGDYGDGPGMDATIFTGGPDFRFRNDTNHWILIQTIVDVSQTLAEVRIYGTDPGRTVQLQGPRISNRIPPPPNPVYVPDPDIPPGGMRRSDTARGGMSIAFSRIVEQDGEVRRDDFLTRFKPWPNIYLVHPSRYALLTKPKPESTPVESNTETPVERVPVEGTPETTVESNPVVTTPTGESSPPPNADPPPPDVVPIPEETPAPPPEQNISPEPVAPLPPPDAPPPPSPDDADDSTDHSE